MPNPIPELRDAIRAAREQERKAEPCQCRECKLGRAIMGEDYETVHD